MTGGSLPRDPATLKPCGTTAAIRRHYRKSEPLDADCQLAAQRDAQDKSTSPTGRSLAVDRRAIRNGLPERRDYVYQGTGYDIYQHLYDDESDL